VSPEAVRQARTEAGLTLAQLARGHVTRGAIHLIETGKARPSMATLQLIAERTGKPISYFVTEPPPQQRPGTAARGGRRSSSGLGWPEVSQLQALAAAQDVAALRDAASHLITNAKDGYARAQAYFYLGTAQVSERAYGPAVESFRMAREFFRQLKDQWMVVECADAEAGALYNQEKPEALAVAEEALARCRELQPMPVATEVRILGHLGSIHASREEWNQAISRYNEAVERAGVVRDLTRIARMYQDLSLAYQGLGALKQAADYSQRALGLYEMQHNGEALAYVENNLGMVLMKLGQLGAAERHLQASLAAFESLGLERNKSHVLLTLSDLQLARDDAQAAQEYAQRALALAERNREQLTEARANQSLGLLAAARHDVDETDRRFRAAIRILTEAGSSERLVECLRSYSQVLETRGDRDAALEQLKQAVEVGRRPLPRVAEDDLASAWRVS
jgi:tetratricopeptide (TPR) repeat protein/DNA-binding XRE family transcriptional regulator